MRCPKCGLLHGGLAGNYYKGKVYPYIAYVCETPGCGHDWMVKAEEHNTDPNHLSLEERVELLERLVFFLMGEANKSNLPSGQDLDVICFGNLLTGQYALECIDKAKGGEG